MYIKYIILILKLALCKILLKLLNRDILCVFKFYILFHKHYIYVIYNIVFCIHVYMYTHILFINLLVYIIFFVL